MLRPVREIPHLMALAVRVVASLAVTGGFSVGYRLPTVLFVTIYTTVKRKSRVVVRFVALHMYATLGVSKSTVVRSSMQRV